jgi:hypothetical protein
MIRGCSVLLLFAMSSGLSAQDAPLLAGAAMTSTQYGWLSGTGPSVVAAQHIVGRKAIALRADVRLQRADLSGAPQSCVLVEQTYCFGRSDRVASGAFGLTTMIRIQDFRSGGALYVLPLQVALRHSRATSGELRGPTGICIVGGELVSCPDNPPFEQREAEWSVTGFEAATGMGVRFNIRWLSLHVESRVVSIPGPTRRGQMAEVALMLGRRLTGS